MAERTGEFSQNPNGGATSRLLVYGQQRHPMMSACTEVISKLVPNFADGMCHVVSATDLYGRIQGFLDRSPHFFLQYGDLALQIGGVSDETVIYVHGSCSTITSD
jgi:hypothetical protein